MLKQFGIMVMGALLAVAGGYESSNAADMTIRLGMGDAMDSGAGAFSTKFKEIVETKTEGKVEVILFPNCQLGDEAEMFQNVRRGTLDLACIGIGNAVPFVPALGAYTLPYLLPNEEAVVKATTGEMFDYFNEMAAKQGGIRLLGHCYSNYRHLTNSVRPVTCLADVKGLKIRVPASKINVATYQSWNANPVPMGWAETFTALQQGVIDGQDNPYVVNYTTKIQEVQKYLTELHHQYSLQPLFVGLKRFKKLDPALQQILIDAGAEASAYVLQWENEHSGEARKAMEAAGVEVTILKDEDVWAERARAVWPDYYDFVGGKEVVDKMLAAIGQ